MASGHNDQLTLAWAMAILSSTQSPVILTSHDRQAQEDRSNARHDYEETLEAEVKIMLMHKNLGALCEEQWGNCSSYARNSLIC